MKTCLPCSGVLFTAGEANILIAPVAKGTQPQSISKRLTTPFTLLSPDGTLVEGKLLTLEHIPIASSTLSRAAGNNSVQPRSLELPLQRRLYLPILLEPLRLLRLYTLALLRLLLLLLLLPPAPQALPVMRLPPLPEGVSIDLHHGGFGQGVRADEFVIGRMEGDADDADFAGDALAAPGKVAAVEAEGAEFAVAAAGADEMDAFRADTRVRGLTPFLEGPAWFIYQISVMDGFWQERSGYAHLFLR